MSPERTSDHRSRRRWFPVLALVAVATMINYLDRTVLGIAAPSSPGNSGSRPPRSGLVFSAFSWSYALLQIPGRHLPRSVRDPAHVSHRLVLLVGVHRAHGRGHRADRADRSRASAWACSRRRASPPTAASWRHGFRSANAPAPTRSIRSASMPASPSSACPLFWITQQFGWRGLFIVVGGFGMALGAVLVALYREPSESPRASAEARPHRGRAAAGNTRARASRSAGAPSAGCCAIARSSARRLASSAAIRRRCSSSPGFPPTSSTCAGMTLHQRRHDDDAALHRRVDRGAGGRADL